jgi:hypothetical protein
MTRHFAFALLLLLAVPPRPAKAQEMARALDAVPPNSVVRLRGPDLRRVEGRIGEVMGDTVFVRSGSRMIAVPIAAVRQAEVATDRNHARGMVNGARIGALVGGTLGVLAITAACDECGASDHLQAAAVGFGIGALYFAVPGGLVGLVIGTQNWEPVRHDGYRAGLARAPDGRMGIGIALPTP